MATNPNDKPNQNKTPPPLFAGGLFGNANTASSTGLFGNAASGSSLFGAPSSNQPTSSLFSPVGQQTITPLFGSGTGLPQSAPGNLQASKTGSVFGALGKSTLASNQSEQQKKLAQSSTAAPTLGLFSQNAPNAPPSLFAPPKQQNTQENQLSSSSAPANPSNTTTNNPLTLSFGSGQEGKKEEPAKKQQTPSLFGGLTGQPGSLFGGVTQTGGLGFFGQTSRPTQQKKDEKKQSPASLFSGLSSSTPTVPPKKKETPAVQPTATENAQSAPSKDEQKVAPNAEKTQTPLGAGSLFGGTSPSPSSALFGASPAASASSSLFGGMTSVPAKTQTPTFTSPVPAPILFKSPDAKQPSLFGTSATPSFLGTQNQAPSVPPTPSEQNKPTLGSTSPSLFTQNAPKVDSNIPKETPITSQPQQSSKSEAVSPNQPKLSIPSFMNSNKKQSKPAPTVTNEQKQSKKQTNTAPSLFAGNNNLSTGLFGSKPAQQLMQPSSAKPQLGTVSQPKPATEAKPLDLPSLTERRRKQPVLQLQQTQTIRSSQSDTRMLTKQKTQNDFTTRDTKNSGTAQSSSSAPLFSFLKPKENININQLLDFKILKEQQKSDMFSTFLSQSSKQIIQSVKMYFTVRTEQFKPRQYPPNCTEKERFFTDFTNLFVRVLGLTDHSWQLASQFLKKILAEQRYEKSLFKDTLLCPEFFRNHNIYQVGLGQAFYLNETGSRELGLLVQRMANMWNVERMGVLNFLLKYADLMRRPSDLFVYLFKYLLQSDDKLIETNNQSYRTFIRDCDYIAKRKLLEVISYYNTKQKDFKLVPAQQVKNIVKLIQNNQDENLNETSLKVLLNCLNFKQPKEIEVFDLIRQTKSRVMTPLRSLAYKLSTRRTESVPPPKELYQYIRGDEWIDWFDIYLSDSGREGVELQSGEPEQILQSLCTISGALLLRHMLGEKKGLLRFFHLLRDENMASLYYRLLEACIYNEKSIAEVDEFYFRKMHFNLEYQEVIQYVIGFNEQMVPHANEEAILAVLQAKLSLLAKIIEVAPQRLVQLQRYLFYHDYNRHKKFKNNTPEEFTRAQGEKLIHLFLDAINIVSLKGIPNRLLHRIFRVIAHLLRSQHTHRVVLTALRTNRPSFAFLNSSLHHLTLNALNQLLEEVLSGPYLHDLVSAYPQAREDELRAEAYYPFRYRDAELGNLLRHEAGQGQNGGQLLFSIYWMNQLVKVMGKQRFNPYLLLKLLEKMHIEPQTDSSMTGTPFYQKKSTDNRVPTIFEPIISTLNQLPIWEDIGRVLECRIVRSEGRLQLKNKLYLNEPSPDTTRMLLWTLKLVRLAFRLSSLLSKGEQTASAHFAVRTLSALNFISKGKIGSQFSTNASRNKLLSAVLALLSLESPPPVESDISWEAEQSQEQDTVYHALIKYINYNKRTLDFQQATNFLKRPSNDLYQAQHSIVAVALEVLLEVIRLSPETSLDHNLTAYLPLKEEEQAQMKAEMMAKLSSAISAAVNDPQVEHRAINFIYGLKYEAGINKLHKSLSSRLFEEFIHSSHKRQRSCTFNAIVCKYLLGELQSQNYGYQTFTQQFLQGMVSNMKFRDNFLRDYYEFKDSREIGKMVRAYHSKEHSLLNLNQLQRMVEERAIVEIGKQWGTLATAVDVLMVQLVRRKHSQGLLNCLTLFNQLTLNNNLILLQQDLPDASRPLPSPASQHPRLYLRDPLETYTAEGGANRMATAQIQQKNNIVEWLMARGRALSDKVTSYVKFILTIDRYLYANNPVTYSIQRPEVAPLDLFCHLSLGRINFTASQLFAKNSSDATDTVQGIASNLLNRLAQMVKKQHQLQTFSEALKLFGYCLQWLRGKEKYGQTASHYLIRKLQKNMIILLPPSGTLISAESIKVLLSALSMGQKHFSPESRAQVRDAVYAVAEKYWSVLQRGFAEEERAIGQLFQQAATILILLPPQKNQAFAFELLVNIWVRERNFQFFFNQSRVILELARISPEELVKLQLLTRCEIIVPLAARYSRYSDQERRFDGIAWTWAVRIAAELANHPLSILVVSEVSSFLKKYHERIQDLFQPGERLSKSFLQDLQAALELLACLFAHDLWVNFNRKLAEWLTYLLSHKLIKVFVLYAQGKLPFAVLSGNDRALSAVKSLGGEEESLDSLTQENVFATEMRIRMNYCLRNYCLLMRRAFKASHYVQSYFQAPLQDSTRYFSSFWDSFNKQLITLFVYACKQFKVWSGQRKLNETLATVAQCTAAPHSFVQNGYLCTVLDLPSNDYELFSDLYLLNYLVVQLAALHLLKERLYVGKFNSLMSTHTDAFAKRVREHIEAVKIQSRKVNVDMGQYIGEAEFNSVVELIESTKSK